jgi:hypothetical protein
VFELIDAPELKKLQERADALEREGEQAQARVARLRAAVHQARGEDITAEAIALNAGKKPPKPKEPGLKAELEAAEREVEVLRQRQALAGGDVSRWIQVNHEALYARIAEAESREAQRVSEAARQLLAEVGRYYQLGDDRKRMKPLIPVEEDGGSGAARPITTSILGIQGLGQGPGSSLPPRGQVESVLTALASLYAAEHEGEAQGAA